MAVVTAQKLKQYYSDYAEKEVTFTKDVIKSLGLMPRQVYIKYSSGHQSCIIYSSSMIGAKLLLNLDKDTISRLSESKNMISVRFCFMNNDKPSDPITFFIQSRITGMSLFKKETGLYLITCEYTQRPSDTLIQILGSMLEANLVSQQRKGDRVILSPENIRKLGFGSKNGTLVIDNVPRNAIIRDVAFFGIKVMILGNAKFLMDKPYILQVPMKDGSTLRFMGKIIRYEAVEGRKDICSLVLALSENAIPMQYTLALNHHFQSETRK